MACETRNYGGYTLPYKQGIPNRFETEDTVLESLIDAIGSVSVNRGFGISVFANNEQVSTGDGTNAFTVPETFNGMELTGAVASVYIKGVTGTTDVQIRRRRANVDADMLSTKITIGDEYYANDGVVNESNDDIQTGDQIYVDVDAVHSGTAPYGLSVTVEFT